MSELYEGQEMASGYMRHRPALHAPIVRKIKEELLLSGPIRRALDLGCGSGLSLAPLAEAANYSIGIEPSFSMLQYCRLTASRAFRVQGVAEQLPFASESFDCVTAAGSLNYADLRRAFPEIARVLCPQGFLVIYDFSTGRTFRGTDRLDTWFSNFTQRYLPAEDAWRNITPEVLHREAQGIKLLSFTPFEMELTYAKSSYIDYLLTETSVAQAIHRGESAASARKWLEAELENVFTHGLERVVFRGYIAYMQKL